MDGQQLSYDRQYEMNARNVDGSAVAKSTDVRDWNVVWSKWAFPFLVSSAVVYDAFFIHSFIHY